MWRTILDNDACRTRVCGDIIITDTASERLIERLEDLGPSLPEAAVLIPCEDASVRLIAANRRRLEPWFHIKLPPAETVELLMDKARFYPHAAAAGLAVPQTFLIESRAELDAIEGEVAFPCILKPANSATSQWEANVTVSAFRVDDWATLSDLYDRHHHLSPVLLVQQWVEGPDSNLYSCNCYIDESGEVLVSFTAKKTRQWPPHIGKSCLGEECEAPPVLEESLRLLGGVEYTGLGYVEMKQDARTGEFYIIEPNVGRPTGRSAIAEAGGVELLYTMYCDAAGLPLPSRRVQTYSGAKWIHLRHDFQSALYYWQTWRAHARRVVALTARAQGLRTLLAARSASVLQRPVAGGPGGHLAGAAPQVVEVRVRLGGGAALPPLAEHLLQVPEEGLRVAPRKDRVRLLASPGSGPLP